MAVAVAKAAGQSPVRRSARPSPTLQDKLCFRPQLRPPLHSQQSTSGRSQGILSTSHAQGAIVDRMLGLSIPNCDKKLRTFRPSDHPALCRISLVTHRCTPHGLNQATGRLLIPQQHCSKHPPSDLILRRSILLPIRDCTRA
ncbi:hypothetical protein BJY04DRAFT_62796 [Aspergillus karnatakaensis]|uniref:uncharacterized protein n=1 Tax=Aspergillus karnatakaensis TaxID=1810916 RepID=UPI003CCD5A43